MESQSQYDEFDLRNYINVVLKRRKLVLSIFFIAVIGSAIVSLLMPRVYEARALLLIFPSKIETSLDTSNPFVDDVKKNFSTDQKPTISLETHKVLMESSAVLQGVTSKSNLTEDLFRKKISLKNDDQTSVFQLSVRDKDPAVAMDLANLWAREYIHYCQDLVSGDIKGMGDFVEDQFTVAKKDFMQAEQKLAAFKEQYKVDLMQAELKMKKDKLNSYKSDLLNTQADIDMEQDLLKELKNQIAHQDKFIVTSKAITDDALWQQSAQVKDPGAGGFDNKKLTSESVNPIYQELTRHSIITETDLNVNRSKMVFLQDNVISMQKDIDDLEATFDQKQIEFDQLTRERDTAQKIYENLSAKIQEARLFQAAQLGEIKLISEAYLPQHPVSSDKIKNVMSFGVIGLMLGSFIVFFMEWFNKKPYGNR